jgi:hypothetical protein
MADYGEIIDDYDPYREKIYTMFILYFNNPTMVKVKDTDEHSMYICKLYCLLNRECRYIIVFSDKNNESVGTLEKLENIQWVSLQTRTLPDNYENVNTVHGYQPVAEGDLMAVINRIKVTKETSTYSCQDIPILVTLLHTQKNTADTYQAKGTVIHALETFQTIITFVDTSFS